MDKQRIANNIKQLEMARKLVSLAMEDLKNVASIRESEAGNVTARTKILNAIDALIEVAKEELK